MLCSVLIPLYNKARYIEDAIRSVMSQSYRDFELIVVDDGSTDDGPDRVMAFEDARIRLIRQTNQGVSCARNRGIDEARGEIVCFLDADDWYRSAYLETIVSMAKRWPEVSFFGTGYCRVNARQERCGFQMPIDLTQLCVIEDCYAHYLRHGPFICTNSVAVRRELLVSVRPCFAPGESLGEDQDLWFRLGEISSLVYCPAELSAYRMEVTGSLTAIASRTNASLDPAILRIERRVHEMKTPLRLRRSALKLAARARVTSARTAIISGNRREALALLVGGWRGAGVRRWWLTLAMCFAVPAALVRHWEQWRYSRIKDW